jgi:hypothetical protein
MLASAFLCGAWLEYPRWRPALVAVVFAVLAVQSATILSRIRSNPMGRAFLPVVSFLDGNYSNRRIYGSAELGMAPGFPRNYVDDPSLGFYTHSEPDAFVGEDVGYQQSFAAFRTRSPEVYNYISHLRDSYVCVYDRGNYRVYSRHRTWTIVAATKLNGSGSTKQASIFRRGAVIHQVACTIPHITSIS